SWTTATADTGSETRTTAGCILRLGATPPSTASSTGSPTPPSCQISRWWQMQWNLRAGLLPAPYGGDCQAISRLAPARLGTTNILTCCCGATSPQLYVGPSAQWSSIGC